MRRRMVIFSLAVSAVIFCMARPSRADVTGTILGSVVDQSGAVVPGATVTLRNLNTGLQRTTAADTTGSYEFLAVPAGDNYVVEVEAKGFEKSSQSGIELLVNQKFRADFRLVVGSTTQTVQVTAVSTQAETTSTQLGDVIEDTKMTALPLNGRSYVDLLGLQAGVVPMTSNVVFGSTVSGDLDSGTVSVNGSREAANTPGSGRMAHWFAYSAGRSPGIEPSRLGAGHVL